MSTEVPLRAISPNDDSTVSKNVGEGGNEEPAAQHELEAEAWMGASRVFPRMGFAGHGVVCQ